MATRSISYHLGLPVFIAAAALLALAVGLLSWSALVSRYAVERGLSDEARVLGIAVEREVGTWIALLHALAAAPPPGCTASRSFHAHAKAVAALHEGWIVLAEENGQQRMNTLRSLESPLPPARLDAMAGPEGQELIAALRAVRLEKRVAALAFSADPTDEERDRALAAGYDRFVAKPCEPGVLLRAVKAVAGTTG